MFIFVFVCGQASENIVDQVQIRYTGLSKKTLLSRPGNE